jgi:hypothetical protein
VEGVNADVETGKWTAVFVEKYHLQKEDLFESNKLKTPSVCMSAEWGIRKKNSDHV